MKKVVLCIGLAGLFSFGIFAQKTESKLSSKAANKTAVTKDGKSVTLASGTQLSGQLQKSLDVSKAKVGDEVVLKTKKSIKQNGEVVVAKGSSLIGRVTEVQKRTKDNSASKIGILFDRLEQGGNSLPISAAIMSVVQARSHVQSGDDLFADTSASSSTRTSTTGSGSGGGLLGGVGNTVGGVVNTTTQTVGGVANTATQTVGGVTDTAGRTVGSTTQAVGGTLRGLQISQSADASASGASTLSLTGGNLKLEKGTTFNVRVTEMTTLGSTQPN
jgi:hypothetical protein